MYLKALMSQVNVHVVQALQECIAKICWHLHIKIMMELLAFQDAIVPKCTTIQ